MTDPLLTFFVPGIPSPGGSKRAFVFPGKDGRNRASIVDAGGKKTANWRSVVSFFGRQAWPAALLAIPLHVRFEFTMPRPKAHFRGKSNVIRDDAPTYHDKKPDALKLARSTEDALTGIVWQDDAQTVHLESIKRYGDKPGCLVTIYDLGQANITPIRPTIGLFGEKL